MKKIIFILFFYVATAQAGENDKFYIKKYDEPGFKLIIKEIERQDNFSILQVKSEKSDAQGGPFSIIRAAVFIGKQLKQTHFTVIKEYRKGKEYFFKIFFTSDTSVDPNIVFPCEMSEENILKFKSMGYLAIERYEKLFNLQFK